MADTLRDADKVVADILQADMDLAADHVRLGNQAGILPPDTGLFVVVFMRPGPTIGQSSELDASTNPPREVQTLTNLYNVTIDVMSLYPGQDARTRLPDVYMALQGMTAQRAMSEHQMQIGRAQPAVDLSETDGATRLLRYQISVNVTVLHLSLIHISEPTRPY